MLPTEITTIEKLYDYLFAAMQLEHATIPPYLTALYSIHPGTNSDAAHILRVVVVEEMLHLTLAANIFNAVGGQPTLIDEEFVPTYPTYLPDGEKDFMVSLQRFSSEAIETFLKIERPAKAPDENSRLIQQPTAGRSFMSRVLRHRGIDAQYYSIGEFYAEIGRGLDYLAGTLGPENLYTGDRAKQANSEYYYSGGGELFEVTGHDSAKAAIDLISGQGEGLDGGIYDKEGELAHFYRFQQLILKQYYQPGDQPGEPSGPALSVDWNATYPIEQDSRVEHYKDSPELYHAAVAFNRAYADFLKMLTTAFNGQPQLLLDAVPQMFQLRGKITQLINNPIPGREGLNAAPTFEVAPFLKEMQK